MIKKIFTGLVLTVMTLCLFSGCFRLWPSEKMDTPEGEIGCEFRIGKHAINTRETAQTDVIFDKDKFVELYNEEAKYDPAYYKHHLNKLDLRLFEDDEPEETEAMLASEVNIRAVFDNKTRNVSIFRYDGKLYFFVLRMGGASRPEDIGYYYKEVPKKMASYWLPIYEEVLKQSAEDHTEVYGSFTNSPTFCYTNDYCAKCINGSEGNIIIQICDRDDSIVYSFTPCSKSSFKGFCWENRHCYNLWIQSDETGIICYSMNNEVWELNENAVLPVYINGV